MANKSSGCTLGTVNERRLRPVYDLLDNGNNKNAVHEADKVLKKQKDLSAAKVLKTIALHRLGRSAEAFALSQEVAITGPTDENSLQGLTLYYRETKRTDLIPPMYEVALAKCPGNEEYMTHLFMSYVRTGNPKEMQRVALNLFKQHPKNPYLFWGVMSIVMQANENTNLGKVMFLPLAEKMIEKQITRGRLEAEAETRLYLMVLDALGKYEKAAEVLRTEVRINKDKVQEMMTDLNKKMGKWDKVNASAKKLFRENPDIWNHTFDYLESLKHLIETEWKPDKDAESCSDSANVDFSWDAAMKLFIDLKQTEIQENCDRPRRGPHLAVIELALRMRELDVGPEADEELGNIVDLIIDYAKIFSSKPCCFTDLKKYIRVATDIEKLKILEKVNLIVTSRSTETSNGEVCDREKEKEILSHLLFVKLQRYLGYHDTLNRDKKLELVTDFLKRHEDGLRFSEYRPSTDLRVVDDYCLISANILHDLFLKEGDTEFAWRALYVLELAKQKSESNHKFKFMLIRLYCDFGIFMPCAQIYDSLEIKHVQQDTLGYLVCNSVSSLGHYQLASQAFEASRAYFLSNERDSLEFLISCFKNGTFHKVPEFVSFRKRVKSSFQSTHTLLEHAYMDLVTQADMETTLSELLDSSCLPDRLTNFDELVDNRDFSLAFDWAPDNCSMTAKHIETSFKLEKKWLQFREIQIRICIQLLTKDISDGSLLPTLEKSIQELNHPHLNIKSPFHGPPRPRTLSALQCGYPSSIQILLELFEKIVTQSLSFNANFEVLSNSLFSGFQGSISELSKMTSDKKADSVQNHIADCDAATSVTSQEPVAIAMTLPVPESLRGLNRSKLERLVFTTELFSLSVLLAFNCQPLISEIKSEAIKKRRRKKGKQEVLPPIIQFYQGFVKNLEDVGINLKSVIGKMQLHSEMMTLDLAEVSTEDKLPNGVTESMQEGTPSKIIEELPTQLVKMASGSLLNATKQLSVVLEGRLKNLQVIKI